MINSSSPSAILYELELTGDVQEHLPGAPPTRRSSSFLVSALWPEAAAVAGRQLFVGEASRRGMTVGPGVQVNRCTPLER